MSSFHIAEVWDSSFSKRLHVKLTSFLFLPRCCPFAICHRYAEPFSKTCSNCSVIRSIWLYNILELVHYHKRNTPTQKRVNIFEGQGHFDWKTEHLWKCSISESLQWLGFLLIKKKEEFWLSPMTKALHLAPIQKINGKWKPNIDLWVKRLKVNFPTTLFSWQNIFMPFNHTCIQLRKQMTDDDCKTPRKSKDKKVIGQAQ